MCDTTKAHWPQWENALDVSCVCGMPITRYHSDLCMAHSLILFHFHAFPQEDNLFLSFSYWSPEPEDRAAVGLNKRAEGSKSDVCIYAIVPFQSSVSKNAQLSTLSCPLCSPQARMLHSYTPPHYFALFDSVANSIGMATGSLVKAGTRCRSNVLVVPGR